MSACGVCVSDRREAIEEAALPALRAKKSWRAVSRAAGLDGKHQSLKRHMEAPPGQPEVDEAAALVADKAALVAEVARLREVVKGMRQTMADQEAVIGAQRTCIIALRKLGAEQLLGAQALLSAE